MLLTTEPYELVIPAEVWEAPSVQALAAWLRTEDVWAAIDGLGGYETGDAGQVIWVG